MWLVGYFIGVVVGALLVAYSVIYDVPPGMIVFLVVAGITFGIIVTASVAIWVEKGKDK